MLPPNESVYAAATVPAEVVSVNVATTPLRRNPAVVHAGLAIFPERVTERAVAAPMFGVMSVGFVSTTNFVPVPVC